jgi:hypothetical protein
MKNNKAKTRNITVSPELVDEINRLCDDLGRSFGFRPTISQALKYVLHKVYNGHSLPHPPYDHPGDVA